MLQGSTAWVLLEYNGTKCKHTMYWYWQEYLSGVGEEEDDATLSDKCKWFWVRVLTNLLVLGMIGGAGYLIYYISEKQSIDVSITFAC